MKKVREGLYIGNFFDMCMVVANNSRVEVKITHILSLLSTNYIQPSYTIRAQFGSAAPGKWQLGELPPRRSLSDGNLVGKSNEEKVLSMPGSGIRDYEVEITGQGSQITRMKVPVNDVVTENLLDRLEVCLDFIDKARERGTILVHCMAGVSRSAAVVVAYLMRTENLSCEDALTSLREKSPTTCPNKGFMEQLVMFEQMGNKVDPMHPVYKCFKASRESNATPVKS